MLLSLQRSTVIFWKRLVCPKMIRSFHGVRSLSSLKEFTVQESLPSLPVPPLEQTLHKYEQSIQPLLGEEELQHTHKVIEEFKKGIGPKLQELLLERAKSAENWLSQWWLHYGYLSVRSPVVINSNPGMLLPLQKFEGEKEQLKFAAKIISGILDYKIMLDEKRLPLDKVGQQPLCMQQYNNVFSGCRIPGVNTDFWKKFSDSKPQHIIVISNNHLFSLQVFGKKNKPLNAEQIYKQLKTIKSESKHSTSPVGILTSENRNAWAKIHKKLMKDKKNQASLQSIQNSLFVLCLDKPMPLIQDPVAKMSMAGGMMLHGGGSEMNTGNRWFDKTLQIIIGHDGVSGLNYEHTSAEGVVLVSLIDHALDFCLQKKNIVLPAAGVQEPVKLKFNIGHDIQSAIETAKENIDSLIGDVDLTITDYTRFGKEFAKSMKLSPDALVQIALQLAYYRVYSEPCATYESGSTRRFKLGRTDTIRSCTVPSYLFTRAMDDTGVPVNEKLQFLHQAIQTHKNLINDAISGQAIDRHLLGLKLIAIEKGMNIPNLFMDTAYATSVHHKISSSQVSSKYNCSMNFGPTAPDGFGICYNCQKSHILIAVSALNTSPDTCSKKMTNSIHQSLTDIYHLLQQEPPVSKL
ncbi:carnitine O-acetyltransferase-like isoform X1 [Octopus vulgaris]|uniref:Carnitine O-acetyltransferase-like isoform X1 n=1 Tax=Octopus vulgaris TaxID=6645 RepID=A0AA36EVV0_OCTVU|nr:carnitine O-acetyltransferase-like isoform X1 [Octopus vulgaris]